MTAVVALAARLAAGADLAAVADAVERGAPASDARTRARAAWLREGVAADDGRFDLAVAARAAAAVVRPASILAIGHRDRDVVGAALAAASGAYVVVVDPVAGDAPADGRTSDRIEVLALDSHVALPALAGRRPWPGSAVGEEQARALGRRGPRAFDLVVVDGDHSAAGALLDLLDAEPLLAPGGALLFDDVLEFSDDVRPELAGLRPDLREPRRPTLAGAFAEFCERHPDWDVIAPRGPHDDRAGPCAIVLCPSLAREPSAP